MTVISNTSPLNYLTLIDLQNILSALFGRVLIPDAVWHELGSPAAPQPCEGLARNFAKLVGSPSRLSGSS